MTVTVTAIVLSPRGQVLMLQVPTSGRTSDGGCWVLPELAVSSDDTPRDDDPDRSGSGSISSLCKRVAESFRAEFGVEAVVLLLYPFKTAADQEALCAVMVTASMSPEMGSPGLLGTGSSTLRSTKYIDFNRGWATPREAEKLLTPEVCIDQAASAAMGSRFMMRSAGALASAMPYMRGYSLSDAPIVRTCDRSFREMPAKRVPLKFARTFTPRQLGRLIRGYSEFGPDERWMSRFENNTLHIHRAWTGFEVYRLHLLPSGKEPSRWAVRSAKLNADTVECSLTPRESVGDLRMLMTETLLHSQDRW